MESVGKSRDTVVLVPLSSRQQKPLESLEKNEGVVLRILE